MTNTPCVRGPGSLLSVLLSSAATGNIVCTPAAMDLEDRLWLELLKETSIEEAVQMLWVPGHITFQRTCGVRALWFQPHLNLLAKR